MASEGVAELAARQDGAFAGLPGPAGMGAVAAPESGSYFWTTVASVGALGFIRLKSISALLWRE